MVFLDDIIDEIVGDSDKDIARARHLFLRWINRFPELRALTKAVVVEVQISNVREFYKILKARVEDGTIKSALLANYFKNLR